jgi:hypothetical protein
MDSSAAGQNSRFRERLSAFWDFLILFSGISTARNLSRTRKDPIRRRGLFLFRKERASKSEAESRN